MALTKIMKGDRWMSRQQCTASLVHGLIRMTWHHGGSKSSVGGGPQKPQWVISVSHDRLQCRSKQPHLLNDRYNEGGATNWRQAQRREVLYYFGFLPVPHLCAVKLSTDGTVLLQVLLFYVTSTNPLLSHWGLLLVSHVMLIHAKTQRNKCCFLLCNGASSQITHVLRRKDTCLSAAETGASAVPAQTWLYSCVYCNAFPPQNFTIWMERRLQGKDIDHYCSTDMESDWNTVTPECAVLIRSVQFQKYHAFLLVKWCCPKWIC